MHEFIDPEATSLFQGRRYRGSDFTLIELPNHIPQEFEDWASVELSQLEQKGCIVRWDLEPKKPCLFWGEKSLSVHGKARIKLR